MAIVPWKKLIESDDFQRQKLLEEKLGITQEEMYDVEGDYLAGACLIFSKTKDMGFKKNQSLAEITTHTLSALVESDWDKPQNAIRKTSRAMKKEYVNLNRSISEKTGQEFTNIHFLREDAFKEVEKKEFLANSVNHNGWDVLFSKKDILRGIKIPYKVDELFSFLLGVYFSIGSPGYENQFYLNVKKNRVDFLDDIISKTILTLFNIKGGVNSREVKKKSGYNDKEYSFNNYEYSITSYAHQNFIKNHFKFWKSKRPLNYSRRKYQIPEIILADETSKISMEDKMKYFFIGIINSRGNIQKENKSNIMIMIDKNKSYLEEIQKISQINGYYPTIRPKNNTFILRYSKKILNRLITNQKIPLFYQNKKIFERNSGVFVNSHQIKQLSFFR